MAMHSVDTEDHGRRPSGAEATGRARIADTRRRGSGIAGLISCLDAVYGYALRMAAGNVRDAEAVVEATYARAARAAGDWEEQDTLIRLLGVCNELLAAPPMESSIGGGYAEAGEGGDPRRSMDAPELPGAVELLRGSEAGAGLWGDVDRLGPELRAPVVLCDLQGLSYADVAAVLRVPVTVARERLHRGRALLQSLVVARLRGEEREHLRSIM